MERHQDLHGAREPSDELVASVRAHFHEQMRQAPRLHSVMQLYDLCAGLPGAGMRTDQWLLLQVGSLMMRDREQWAISEHEATPDPRNRQARLPGGKSEGDGGGQRASAMAATIQRIGLPAGKLASGRTKSEATCQFVRPGKNCPEA
eukprot:2755882-Pyramimonas_sp.AAC.1